MVPSLSITNGWFWTIILWDVTLLVLRDADLWTDLADFVKRRFGPVVLRMIELSQLLVGHGDSLAASWSGQEGSDKEGASGVQQRKRAFTLAGAPLASLIQQQVLRREAAISGAISEVLATMILLAFYAAEELFPHDALIWQLAEGRTPTGKENTTLGGLLTRGTREERGDAVVAYSVGYF
jgi:hypothetical protein